MQKGFRRSSSSIESRYLRSDVRSARQEALAVISGRPSQIDVLLAPRARIIQHGGCYRPWSHVLMVPTS